MTVVCDPADYAEVLREVEAKAKVEAEPLSLNLGLNLDLKRRLALKAFRHTAAYDAAIATWLTVDVETLHATSLLPENLNLAAERVQLLRYGENPHQQAALYRRAGAAPAFEQLQGKELSYNNLVDLEAAWGMPHEFAEPTVAIIKHTNPRRTGVGRETGGRVSAGVRAAIRFRRSGRSSRLTGK